LEGTEGVLGTPLHATRVLETKYIQASLFHGDLIGGSETFISVLQTTSTNGVSNKRFLDLPDGSILRYIFQVIEYD
jgi:hypothetical protein